MAVAPLRRGLPIDTEGVPVTLPVAGPPGKPYQPAVAQVGDLLHYATMRDQWERRSQGKGSKGQRYYDWAWFDVVLPGQEPADGFAHHLLIRRSTRKKQLAGGRVDFEYAYFLVHHRRDAALPEAVCRAGVRWKIEENNEQAKQITGLGQYQVRRWNSWHRHVTCAMLALAFLTVPRAQHPEQQPHRRTTRSPTTKLIRTMSREKPDRPGRPAPTADPPDRPGTRRRARRHRPRRPPRARLPPAAAPLASPPSNPGNRQPLQTARRPATRLRPWRPPPPQPITPRRPEAVVRGHQRPEHLRGSALGFRNLTNYIARSLPENGGFRPLLHPGL